jgi:hypothetical protein
MNNLLNPQLRHMVAHAADETVGPPYGCQSRNVEEPVLVAIDSMKSPSVNPSPEGDEIYQTL